MENDKDKNPEIRHEGGEDGKFHPKKSATSSWDIGNPERDGGQIRGKNDFRKNPKTLTDTLAEEIAKESEAETSNGNRDALTDTKPGGAERGGPDVDKAQRRQPPDAEI